MEKGRELNNVTSTSSEDSSPRTFARHAVNSPPCAVHVVLFVRIDTASSSMQYRLTPVPLAAFLQLDNRYLARSPLPPSPSATSSFTSLVWMFPTLSVRCTPLVYPTLLVALTKTPWSGEGSIFGI